MAYSEDSFKKAAKKGDLAAVKRVVEKSGLDVNCMRGHTPLYVASENNHLNIVEYLVDNGADMNKIRVSHQTPLYVAIERGHFDVMKYLVDKGADLNKATTDGNHLTPLHIAVQKGD